MRWLDGLTEREKDLRQKAALAGFSFLVLATFGGLARVGFFDDVGIELSNEDSSKEDLLDLIKQKMNSIPFYSENPGFTYSDTYQDVYMRLIESYLDHFYSYMDDRQIALLIDYIENKFPNYDYDKTDAEKSFWIFLDSVYNSDTKGYGMYKALTVETFGYPTDQYNLDRYDGACYHFSVLANLVGYENLIPAIYEQSPEKIIDVICSETSIEREKAERLMTVFDNYYESYDDTRAIDEDCVNEMKTLLASIIQSKYDTDPVFRNGWFAYALMNSNYFKEDGKEFVADYWENSFCFLTTFSSGDVCWVNLPYYYLNSNIDLDTAIDSSAWAAMVEGYTSSEWYETKAVELLSYIVPWSQVQYMADSNLTTYQKKQMFYDYLKDYFENEREFNEFVINLRMDDPVALDKFFSIWKSQIMSGPPTIQKLLDVNTLHTRIISRCFLDTSDVNADSIERGSEEANIHMSYLKDYYFSSDYDYMKHFDEIRSYFHQQNSTFTDLLSTDSLPVYYAVRSWVNGDRMLSDTTIFPVLSQPLIPQKRKIDEEHFIYCLVKPDNYPEGEFIRVFDNIENRRVEALIPGISTTLKNEETGKEEEVLIVSFDEDSPIDCAYYKADYFELYPNEYDQIIVQSRLVQPQFYK